MTNKDIFDEIMSLPGFAKLYPFYKKRKSVLLYIFCGGLTTIVSIGTFVFCNQVISINELLSNVISWVVAVSFAYVTNRRWVFHSKATGKSVVKEILAFYGGRITTLGIEEAFLFVFVTCLHFNALAIKIIAQFVVLVLNYFISKMLVFSEKKNG